MSDEEQQQKCPAGAPAWVMTFADLMSLLMCFFVLLLSFSEMDVSKYKQIAGSMREAFGVQRKYDVKGIPKGINIIAREFSAGKPEPTVFNVMEQQTTDDWQLHLKTGQDRKNSNQGKEGKRGDDAATGKSSSTKGQAKSKSSISPKQSRELVLIPKAEALAMMKERAADKKAQDEARAEAAAAAEAQVQETSDKLKAALADDLNSGKLEIETIDQRIIIRLHDKASFPAGSVFIRDSFRPVLARVARVLKTTPGNIVVAGHSDNLPFTGDVYRSNWELSAGRAVSVVHELVDEGGLKTNRVTVEGRGDTQPLVENNSAENRARNRRVEIILEQGEDLFAESELGSSTIIAEPVAPADIPADSGTEEANDNDAENIDPPLPGVPSPILDPFISGAADAAQGEEASTVSDDFVTSNASTNRNVITDPLAPEAREQFIEPAEGAAE